MIFATKLQEIKRENCLFLAVVFAMTLSAGIQM